MRPRSVVAGLAAAALALPAGPAAAATSARTIRVASVSALTAAVATARPGDHIELARGSYALRAPLEIKAAGIVLTGNAAAITGTAGVRVSGSDVTVTGLAFGTADTIEIKAGARHVRLTRNTFRLAARAVNWLSVAGDDAEIDHNEFAGKRTAGVFLQVTGPGSTGMAQRTWVHHNYFADHTFGGSNGGEALRLGVSTRQHAIARAVVEDNLFERVNGDQEAISVKSSGNVIRRNTIRNSSGTITLRHGSGNTVDSNLLIGGTTGIRIFGNDQTVVNNIVQDSARAAVHRSGQRRHARRHRQLDRARGGRPGAWRSTRWWCVRTRAPRWTWATTATPFIRTPSRWPTTSWSARTGRCGTNVAPGSAGSATSCPAR